MICPCSDTFWECVSSIIMGELQKFNRVNATKLHFNARSGHTHAVFYSTSFALSAIFIISESAIKFGLYSKT